MTQEQIQKAAEEYANNMQQPADRIFDCMDDFIAGCKYASENADEDTSDGYHTFRELYEYRLLYNAAFANLYAEKYPYRVVKSHRHSDGELCFGGGWFIVMIDLPTGQISNHYENKDWNLFKCMEIENAPEWDGHTPQQAAERLKEYLKSELL